jgi:hypothetical protein
MDYKSFKYKTKYNLLNLNGGFYTENNIDSEHIIEKEIRCRKNNIPGIIISIDNNKKNKGYNVRFLGDSKNTYVDIKDISFDIIPYNITDYTISDNKIYIYQLFKSYTNANINITKLNPSFIEYIKYNLLHKPSNLFLKLVNTNVFLFYFIKKNYDYLLKNNLFITFNNKNKLLINNIIYGTKI